MTKRINHYVSQTGLAHPSEYIPILQAKLTNINGRTRLKVIHETCQSHFDSGRRDFQRDIIAKAAGLHYQTFRYPAYLELLQIWAAYATQHPLVTAQVENHSIEDLYLDALSKIKRVDGRQTIQKIHEACRLHFEEGKLDFKYSVIATKAGLSTNVIRLNNAYKKLIDAWNGYAARKMFPETSELMQTPEVAAAMARRMLGNSQSKESAERLYKVCEKLYAEGELDFSYSRVGKIADVAKGTIRSNKAYRLIIEAWHDAAMTALHGKENKDNEKYQALLDKAIGDSAINSGTRMKLEHIHTMLRGMHASGALEFDGSRISRVTKLSIGALTAAHLRYKTLIDGWEKLTGKSTVYLLTSASGRLIGKDEDFAYLLRIDPSLSTWQKYASEWIATLKRTKDMPMNGLKLFFYDYIHKLGVTTNPKEFLTKGYKAPSFYENCLVHMGTRATVISYYNIVEEFVRFVLTKYFSDELPNGARVVPSNFCNPIPLLPDSLSSKHKAPLDESNKKILPYRFIVMLRDILCPDKATSFKEWTWAHDAISTSSNGMGGDWFVVEPTLIDESDADCVYRTRINQVGELIHEMWCPARAVAMLTKLELPLRMFQVRFLDSGEADLFRYEDGKWITNTSPLAKKGERRRMGVFRNMQSGITKAEMTGLYISTNKTADRGKDELTRGYEVPWEHKKVLYWLERLRNWQEKYNPIEKPVSWTDLDRTHFGSNKSLSQKLRGGDSCFLFRNAAAAGADRQKPIKSQGPINTFWTKLLIALEERLFQAGETAINGTKLTFVRKVVRGEAHIYTLHGLRVSLITSFALEGGVPMAILSKCIAGHSRLVMTLYYTKAGVRYVTDAMEKASQKMFADSKENCLRWMKDASYDQLASQGAYVDPAAVQAVLSAQANGASLVMDDKGLCPKGAMGCDSGGIYKNEDNGTVEYGPVPGFPQKNCPKCRWFFTGPAFLDGLHNHWNIIHLQIAEGGEKVKELAERKAALEDQRYEAQVSKRLFLDDAELYTITKAYENAVAQNDKLGDDQHATLRLIHKCATLANTPLEAEELSLVSTGDIKDVEFAIDECSKLKQLLNAVQISKVYPEHDVSKAILESGRAYDRMLALNGKAPVLFRLSEGEQKAVVQHMTIMLKAHTGSTEGAVDFVEGRRQLSELGFDFSELSILELAHSAKPLLIPNSLSSKPAKRSRATSKVKELENAG